MTTAYPKELDGFVEAARAFVSFCERSHEDQPPIEFQKECLRQLTNVYSNALQIPQAPFRDAPDPPERTDQKWLTKNLVPLPFQYYTEAIEPANLDKNGNVAMGDLFDDFLDIHHDLSDGLWLIDQGHWEAAVWHWRLLHWHWSTHVIGALHALHLFIYPDLMGTIIGQND